MSEEKSEQKFIKIGILEDKSIEISYNGFENDLEIIGLIGVLENKKAEMLDVLTNSTSIKNLNLTQDIAVVLSSLIKAAKTAG